MATTKQIVGTRTSLAFTGTTLSTLASATYVQNTTAYDCTTNQPLDVIVEVDAATTNTPAGNKQLVVFMQESLDGTNYRSGPTSGTTTTREPNLQFLGILPITTASTTEIGTFSVLQALGYVPAKFYVVIKNDLGVALTSGTVFTSEISSTVA
jgi:membrane-bound inhibitor of C-type lysozyme